MVTAAELLSVAAFDEGRHAQAFPTFGSERTGAPVVSFCRIDDEPIRAREPIAEPDALIEQLRKDEAIAEADTLLLTIPNQLGVDYCAHAIEAILKHVAPALGWR